jgi:hypothetical protein
MIRSTHGPSATGARGTFAQKWISLGVDDLRLSTLRFARHLKHLDFMKDLHQFATTMALQTSDARLTEIAETLAVGLMRLRARKSSALSRDFGESSLDCIAPQSGHANALKREGGLD